MINASDFRNGVTLEMDNAIWTVVEFLHVKPGKGAAFVRTKLKNIKTGGVIERTFNPTDKFNKAIIETKEMEYLYNADDLYYFMDTETYDQLMLTPEQVADAMKFVKENTPVTVRFHNGEPFSVSAPNFVELVVTATEPGVAGNTATNATKPATLETGLTINVPLFINLGDKIKIDTREGGEYLGRA